VGTILDRILEQKKMELASLQGNPSVPQNGFARRSLIHNLQKADEISIIAEYKRASPSKGIINNGIGPVEQALQYEEAGAAAISVLTDSTFFQGSFQDLTQIKKTVNIPVLCKDFIIDPLQIDLAAASGADLILLIVAALDEKQLNALYQYARLLGLEVLVEVHNAIELETALKTGARLIGINNRDLKTFHVSLETVEQLGSIVKASGAFLISESGIHQKEDVERVRNAGANGILVGESLMKSQNIKGQIQSFKLPLNREVK
jgi:indole-3-glycerol phosphate synthase